MSDRVIPEVKDEAQKESPIFNALDGARDYVRKLLIGRDNGSCKMVESEYTGSHEHKKGETSSGITSERKRRLLEWLDRKSASEESYREQEKLREMGDELRKIRWLKARTPEEVAQEIGIAPSVLCFLESGLGTKEEFTEIVDRWAEAVGADAERYHNQLSRLHID